VLARVRRAGALAPLRLRPVDALVPLGLAVQLVAVVPRATTLADDAVDGVVGAKRAVATTTSREVQRARRTAAAGARAARRTGEEAREGATRTARTARSGVKATAKTARSPRGGVKATAKTARTPVKSRPRKTSASKATARKRSTQRS